MSAATAHWEESNLETNCAEPIKLCPSKVGQVNSAKASERKEGSGLKREAWGAREAQPGKV